MRVLLLVPFMLSPLPTAAGGRQMDDDLLRRMNELHGAAELYLAGNTDGALLVLTRHPIADQRPVIQKIPRAMRFPLPQTPYRTALLWTPRHVRAFAALEMEAALRAYTDRARSLREHAELGAVLFTYIDKAKEASAGARWRLAIGLKAHADGQFGWAESVLEPACRDYPNDPQLRLACGSLHEAIGMLPAAQLLRTQPVKQPARPAPAGVRVPDEGLRFSETMFQKARSIRDDHLDRARAHFEQLLRIDPGTVDGRVRLAHVRTLTGDDARALPLLESVLSRKQPDARTAYLARLFLAGINERARQFAAARAALEQAIAVVPAGQSAFVALAHVAHLRGDSASAAAAVEQMLRAPTWPEDPWSGYRFGQYWIVDGLLATLRKEAVQ